MRPPAPTWPNSWLVLRRHPQINDKDIQVNMQSPQTLPIVVLACQVLQDMLERMLPNGVTERVSFMDYGLHRVPAKMTWTLQDEIDAIENPSLIVLGYGLCGNGLKGIRAGEHTLLIPRVDDCIALLLGSRQAYIQQFEAEPGTYWLSKGWLESGSHPLKEYTEYSEKYGPKEAEWLMDQQYEHYQRLVMVAHNQEDLEAYRPKALEVAKFCERWDYRYEEILGSERYIKKLVELTVTAGDDLDRFHQLVRQDDEFILVTPGGEIRQDMFI